LFFLVLVLVVVTLVFVLALLLELTLLTNMIIAADMVLNATMEMPTEAAVTLTMMARVSAHSHSALTTACLHDSRWLTRPFTGGRENTATRSKSNRR
jgi:predicted house-cleaning NTP pyrophosphatase (Maf/HAM1 superfamily)